MHCCRESPVSHLLNLLDVLVLAFVLFCVARRKCVLDVHCLQIRTGRHVRCHSDLLHVLNRGLTAAIVSSVWTEGGAGERQRIAGSLGYSRHKSSPDVWPVLCECFLGGALPEIKNGQKYQGSKNPGRQLARSTKFWTVALNICAFSE
jgi:hypothetical protein